MADAELLGPLRALAALLPEAAGIQGEHLGKVASQLKAFESEAVISFLKAGEKCLGKLTGDTVVMLQRVLAGTRAVARDRKDFIETDDGKAQSVYELLERYDTDKDGVLSRSEFLSAATVLMGDDAMSPKDLDSLANQVDKNRDGSIDIHEFTVWLYTEMADNSGDKKSEPPARSKENCSPPLKDVEKLNEKLEAMQAELDTKSRALAAIETRHEEEIDASLDFWRGIAKNCVLTIDNMVDLANSTWLGNGKFGFVLKATRLKDGREVVVKMMGLRWAHLAVKEWQHGSTMGKHANLVDYDDVMLHNDDDDQFEKLLKKGYAEGKLKSRQKRTAFPDRYICLTQELMNRGTVQDWMDDNCLFPGGILDIMQKVAGALAFMHKNGVTHNDIKPENVMLHQEDSSTENAPVTVKLGDLGCCAKSEDTTADYWQYGMTAFCMVTGEKFGARKYRAELASGFCDECERGLKAREVPGSLGASLSKVPDLMRRIYPKEVTMSEVHNEPLLQGWSFFDGSDLDSGLQQSLSRTMTLHMSGMNDAVARHACLHIDAIDE
jgi:hypothetical protein